MTSIDNGALLVEACLVGVALSCAGIACSVDLAVPPGAEIRCTPLSDCPAHTTCIAELGRCLPAQSACIDRIADTYRPVHDGNQCQRQDGESGICVTGRCELQPFVALTVQDPGSLAVRFASLMVGPALDALNTLDVMEAAGTGFPMSVMVFSSAVGEQTLWLEARDGSGAVLGRGRTQAAFKTSGSPSASISLVQPCTDEADCNDGLFCTGVETCADAMCAPGSSPCAANVSCVTSSCVEGNGGAGQCDTQVDHAQCGPGLYCNPVQGCTPGQGCYQDADCVDAFACNGQERCVNLLCTPGVPPVADDGDECTLDGCDDARVALGEQPIFHVALLSFDGSACTISTTAQPGVCVASKGG